MFELKNRNDPELSDVNFHAGLSHSKQLLKNIHRMMLASFCSLTKHIYSDHTEKLTERPTVHIPIKQEERHHDKRTAHN